MVDIQIKTPAVKKLIEVVANGIGTWYEPIGIVRKARANAAAELILSDTDAEIARRAAARVMRTEILRQENIESIVQIAKDELPSLKSNDEPVNQDWINRFFSSVGDVSTEDMQRLWGKLLAGEVAKPGSYSFRTLDFLKTMAPDEAAWFSHLCSCLCTMQGWGFYFMNSPIAVAMQQKVGDIAWDRHFADIGLITARERVVSTSDMANAQIGFDGKSYLFVPHDVGAPGQVVQDYFQVRDLSAVGQQLYRLAPVEMDLKFFAQLKEYLLKFPGVVLMEMT